jgi:hypothetical protein
MATLAPATPAQLYRTASRRFDVRWRVLVGAPLDYVNLSLYRQGEPVVLPAQTRLTMPFQAGVDTAMPVDDTAGYQSAGTVVLSYFNPIRQSTTTGRFSYTGKTETIFTGVKSIDAAQGRDTFPVGTQVAMWRDITDIIYVDRIERVSFADASKGDWTIALEGRNYRDDLLPEDCSVLVQARFTPHDGRIGLWTDWLTMGLGFIRDFPSISGDVDKLRNWATTVESVSAYDTTHHFPGKRYGQPNIAAGASATASPSLTNALLEIREFRGAVGTTDAANVTDGIRDSLYISNAVPTLAPETPAPGIAEGGACIDEVYCWGGIGYPQDLQFIVIAAVPSHPNYADTAISLRQVGLQTKMTVLNEDPGPSAKRMFLGGSNYIRLPDVRIGVDNPRIIICRNAQVFRRYFSVDSGISIYDWRFLPGFDNDGLEGANVILDPAGDLVQLRVDENAVEFNVRDMAAWGNQATYWYNGYDENESAAQWNDPVNVPVPPAGNSIRRIPALQDTNTAADWQAEPEPLLHLTEGNNDGVFTSLQLPPWVCHLTEDITASYPPTGMDSIITVDDAGNLDHIGIIQINTEQIFYRRFGNELKNIVRGFGGTTPADHTTAALIFQVGEWILTSDVLAVAMSPTAPPNGGTVIMGSTHQLPASGVGRFDDEVISWTGKTTTTLTGITRGAGGTIPASHAIRWAIHSLDASLGAHRYPLVSRAVVRRTVRTYSHNGATIKIAPINLEIWGSQEDTPQFQGDGAWRETWLTGYPLHTYVTTPKLASAEIHTSLGIPRRLAHLMVRIRLMSDYDIPGQSGRAKINEIEVYTHQVMAADAPVRNDEPGIGAVLYELLTQVPSAGVSIEQGAFTGTSGDEEIAEGGVGGIVADLLERFAGKVTYTFDNRKVVSRNPFHPNGTRPPIRATFTPDMIRGRVEPMQVGRRSPLRVGQVIVTAIDSKTGELYEGRYPAYAGAGTVKTVPLEVAAGSTQLATQYAMALYLADPDTAQVFSFATVGPCEWLQEGDRIVVWDDHNGARQTGRYVNCSVESVTMLAGVGYARVIAREWRMR